jgi:thioesterase domain-containing protein
VNVVRKGARNSAASDGLSSLIVPLRTAGRQPPVFFMHDVFDSMAAELRTDRAIYAVDYRCSDKMKSCLSVVDIAASHLTEIFKVQPHGPYYLVGFSLGALAAYEMATLLVSRGERVALLALIDIYNPALYHASTTDAVEFRKRYRADRLRKYLGNLMRGNFYRLAADGSKLLKEKIKVVTSGIFAKQFAQSLEMIVNAYSPKEFQGRLVLLRVEKPVDGGAEFEHDPTLGWNNCVKGGVDVKYVTGTHGTVMDMPHVIDLATKLAPYL